MRARAAGVVVVGALGALIEAVRVAPQSTCARYCGNTLDDTSGADIVCNEADYSGATGQVFSGCVDCELRSNYVYETDGQSDQQWLLYNVRYATSYCLFGVPGGEVDSNPCITSHACQPLQDAITYMNLTASTSNSSIYDYCDSWLSNAVAGCENCLRAGSRNILSNLITVLDTGCAQRPAAGSTIAIVGEIFSSTDVVNATTPTPSLESQYDTTTGFPVGAKVGIALGAVVVVLGVVGCCIIYIGKRRRRAFLDRLQNQTSHNMPAVTFTYAQNNPRAAPAQVVTSWPRDPSGLGLGLTPQSGSGVDLYNDTPLSQRPLRGGWDDSPLSASTDRSAMTTQAFPRYWSPYGSPVSPDDGRAQFAQFAQPARHPGENTTPMQPREIGLAFGGEDPVVDDRVGMSPRKGKEKEAAEEYEMYRLGHEGGPPQQMPPSVPPPPVLPADFHHQPAPRSYEQRSYEQRRGRDRRGTGQHVSDEGGMI